MKANLDLLDDKLYGVYLNAMQSGDKDYYDFEDPKTHPDFGTDLEELEWGELRELYEFFNGNLLVAEKELARTRNEVEFKKEVWGKAEIDTYNLYQKALVKVDRLKHMVKDMENALLLKKIALRIEATLKRVGDVLDWSADEIEAFVAEHGFEALRNLDVQLSAPTKLEA